MNKIWIIIQREYITRVKTKSFLISTFLVPLGFALIMIIPIVSTLISEKEHLKIHVIDYSGRVEKNLISDETFTFISAGAEYEALSENLLDKKGEGILIIPEDLDGEEIEINYRSSANLTIDQESKLRIGLRNILKDLRIETLGISKDLLNKLNINLSFSTGKISRDGTERKTNTLIAAALGYLMAFLIYMCMIIYGSFVMRGVVEEKTNRVVEIVVSSVKPFELMIGKIIGIGAMGLTQFTIWIIMKSIIIFIGFTILALIKMPADPAALQHVSSAPISPEQIQEILMELERSFSFKLIFFFFFYFIGGYLLYGSLFAAVGSTVEQESDAHQMSFPLVIPLILPMLFLGKILRNPSGGIARFASIFPFFSPMTMLVRLASVEVPWYEISISMLLLILAFLVSVWISARIYRTGILMYGKKPGFAEIARWIFHKL